MHHLPSRYIPCDGRLTASAYFKSTLPAWGATKWTPVLSPAYTFQSTLPVGGTTLRFVFTDVFSNISIHAPRMGSDYVEAVNLGIINISIHAPRMGSDSTVKAYSNDRIKRSTLREPHFSILRMRIFRPLSPCVLLLRAQKNQRIRVSFGSYPGLAPTCFTLDWYRFPRL